MSPIALKGPGWCWTVSRNRNRSGNTGDTFTPQGKFRLGHKGHTAEYVLLSCTDNSTFCKDLEPSISSIISHVCKGPLQTPWTFHDPDGDSKVTSCFTTVWSFRIMVTRKSDNAHSVGLPTSVCTSAPTSWLLNLPTGQKGLWCFYNMTVHCQMNSGMVRLQRFQPTFWTDGERW